MTEPLYKKEARARFRARALGSLLSGALIGFAVWVAHHGWGQ